MIIQCIIFYMYLYIEQKFWLNIILYSKLHTFFFIIIQFVAYDILFIEQ